MNYPLSKIIGTTCMPDGNIRPIYEICADPFSIPAMFKCYVNWEQDDGKQMAFCMKFYKHEYKDDTQMLERFNYFLKKQWEAKEGKQP